MVNEINDMECLTAVMKGKKKNSAKRGIIGTTFSVHEIALPTYPLDLYGLRPISD